MTMRRKDRLVLAKMIRDLRLGKDCIAIPLAEAARLEGIDPKLVEGIDERELWRGSPSFGGQGGTVTIGDLGDYMDEVNDEILRFNNDFIDPKNKLAGSASFRGRWNHFLYTAPYDLAIPVAPFTSPSPSGWADFYARERDFVSRIFEVTELWGATKRFEDQFIELWNEAKSPQEGFKLTGPAPKKGFDEPTTAKTLADTASTLLTVATIAVGVWGVSQILKLRGGSS